MSPDAVKNSSTSDAYCYPHSSAMNSSEIRRFFIRASMFEKRNYPNAEALADKLCRRDRDIFDKRRVCIECDGLQKNGSCKKTKTNPVRDVLQHCEQFDWLKP